MMEGGSQRSLAWSPRFSDEESEAFRSPGPAWSPPAGGPELGGRGRREGEGWRVLTPHGCSASGSAVPLGVSGLLSPRTQCEASGRQARPAAAAQAAGTCEKFVKGDERKERKGRRAAANTWPGSPASCLPAMAS